MSRCFIKSCVPSSGSNLWVLPVLASQAVGEALGLWSWWRRARKLPDRMQMGKRNHSAVKWEIWGLKHVLRGGGRPGRQRRYDVMGTYHSPSSVEGSGNSIASRTEMGRRTQVGRPMLISHLNQLKLHLPPVPLATRSCFLFSMHRGAQVEVSCGIPILKGPPHAPGH